MIERIVAPIGRRIDESSPMVDARLKDGSRVNAIIPPLAIKGPALTTLYANSPRDALARLETLVLMAGMDLPLVAIRDQVVSAVDIIIQQARLADGRRAITGIVEVTGMESNKIQLQELFKYEQRGRDSNDRILGHFTGCNAVPSFYEGLREAGIPLDLSIFNRQGEA